MSAQFMEGLEGRQLFSGSPVGAGQVGPGPDANGTGIHQRDQDRLQDGSCQATVVASSTAADGVQDRLQQRLRDGSCKA